MDEGRTTGMDWSGVMIYHPIQLAIASHTWAEIVHAKSTSEIHGGWYYYFPGSAVWLNIGRTEAFGDHKDAAEKYLGSSADCQTYHGNCNNLNDQIFPAACEQGLNTIQYLNHDDWDCGFSMVIEIVDVCGSGAFSCAGHGTEWKMGWDASHHCSCDEAKGAYNCGGGVPKW